MGWQIPVVSQGKASYDRVALPGASELIPKSAKYEPLNVNKTVHVELCSDLGLNLDNVSKLGGGGVGGGDHV